MAAEGAGRRAEPSNQVWHPLADVLDSREQWVVRAEMLVDESRARYPHGKDVAFSVDHFEEIGTSHWDGVRNALAKRYMKEEMKLGDKVLFYHSNTKVPGVAALAEVVKEGYPDHTAWDVEHPYFDAKSKKEAPTWFMVDVAFRERVATLVPLALYKALAELSEPPEQVSYLTQEHLDAIKSMPLINKGRLSVQPVSTLAYEATLLLGKNGGFADLVQKPKPKPKAKTTKPKPKRKSAAEDDAEEGGENVEKQAPEEAQPSKRPRRGKK